MTTTTITADELAKLIERIPKEWNPHGIKRIGGRNSGLLGTKTGSDIEPAEAASLLLGGIMQEMNARTLRPMWDSGVYEGREHFRFLWCHKNEWERPTGKRSIRGIGQTDLHAAVAAVEAISKESKRD